MPPQPTPLTTFPKAGFRKHVHDEEASSQDVSCLNLSYMIECVIIASYYLQNCPFYFALQQNPLNFSRYRCDMSQMPLTDCRLILNLDNVEHKEHKVLLLRAGISPDNFDRQLKICINHRDILGRKFNRYLKWDNCRYRGHVDDKTKKLSEKTSRQITYPEALAALKCQDLQLPLGMPICNSCYKSVTALIGPLPMNTDTDSEISSLESSERLTGESWKSTSEKQQAESDGDSMNLIPLSQTLNEIPVQTRPVTRAHPLSEDQLMLEPEPVDQGQPIQQANAGATSVEQGKPHKQKMLALNHYLDAWGLQKFPGAKHFKNRQFQDCSDPGRQRMVLQGIARGVFALLQTASETESDWSVMWNQLQKSGFVEKELGIEKQMSAEMREHVLLYNRAPNYPVRTQILAILFPVFRYCEINRFNYKPEESINDEHESDIDISQLETEGLFFDPPVSPHLWKQSGIHGQGGALEQVVRQPVVKWFFEIECVQAVQAYANHPDVLQRVAYGTRLVDKVYGDGKTEVANVFRTTHDAQLALEISDHLVEQDIPKPHPCIRTITRMLKNMPAGKTRSLEVRKRVLLSST